MGFSAPTRSRSTAGGCCSGGLGWLPGRGYSPSLAGGTRYGKRSSKVPTGSSVKQISTSGPWSSQIRSMCISSLSFSNSMMHLCFFASALGHGSYVVRSTINAPPAVGTSMIGDRREGFGHGSHRQHRGLRCRGRCAADCHTTQRRGLCCRGRCTADCHTTQRRGLCCRGRCAADCHTTQRRGLCCRGRCTADCHTTQCRGLCCCLGNYGAQGLGLHRLGRCTADCHTTQCRGLCHVIQHGSILPLPC